MLTEAQRVCSQENYYLLHTGSGKKKCHNVWTGVKETVLLPIREIPMVVKTDKAERKKGGGGEKAQAPKQVAGEPAGLQVY